MPGKRPYGERLHPDALQTPISTRLPWWLDGEIRQEFLSRGEGPAEGLRRVVIEWWTQELHPALEFRDGPYGRYAAVRGGPGVWEIMRLWNLDLEKVEDVVDRFDPPVTLRVLEHIHEYMCNCGELVLATIAAAERAAGREPAPEWWPGNAR